MQEQISEVFFNSPPDFPTKDIKKKNRYNLRSTKKKELETKLKSNSKDSDSEQGSEISSEDEMDHKEYQKFLSKLFPSKHMTEKVKATNTEKSKKSKTKSKTKAKGKSKKSSEEEEEEEDEEELWETEEDEDEDDDDDDFIDSKGNFNIIFDKIKRIIYRSVNMSISSKIKNTIRPIFVENLNYFFFIVNINFSEGVVFTFNIL